MTLVLRLKHWLGLDPLPECVPEADHTLRYRAKTEKDFGRALGELTEETKVRGKESDTLKRLREKAILAREQWGAKDRMYPNE